MFLKFNNPLSYASSQKYNDGSERGEYTTVSYHGVVAEVGAPEDDAVRRCRRNKKSNNYLSGQVVSYCGTTIRSFMHLADIEH